MRLNIKITQDIEILNLYLSNMFGFNVKYESRVYAVYVDTERFTVRFPIQCLDKQSYHGWLSSLDPGEIVMNDTDLPDFMIKHRGELVMNKLNLI